MRQELYDVIMTPIAEFFFHSSIQHYLGKGRPDVAAFEVDLYGLKKLQDSGGKCQAESIPGRACAAEASVDIQIDVLLLPLLSAMKAAN